MLPEVTPERLALAKLTVILVATLCDRLVKLTRPLAAVAVGVPCNMPLPPFRLAATAVLLSLEIRFPKESSIRNTGCCAKAAPAVAVVEGWGWIGSRFAAAELTATELELMAVQ